MSRISLLSVFVLSLIGLSCSQEFSSQFAAYECSIYFPGQNHPHVLYDAAPNGIPRRRHSWKVVDGLGLMTRMTENATEAGAHYIPDLSGMTITRDAMRKLVKIVQLPYFISNRPVQERIVFEAPTGALDTVAADMCKVIKSHLSGVYKTFSCTEEELKDLDARLEYADLLEKNHAAITSHTTVHQPLAHQCQYWNTRGLDGCVVGNSATQQEFEVNAGIVRPLYEEDCNCDHPLSSPICIVENTTPTS